MTNDDGRKIKYGRVVSLLVYLLVGAALIYWRQKSMFYLEVNPTSESLFRLFNVDRIIWCFSCSCFGFAFLVSTLLEHKHSVLPSYVTYYPILLFVISCLSFSIFHIFEQTSGFDFYYLSGTACFILSAFG